MKVKTYVYKCGVELGSSTVNEFLGQLRDAVGDLYSDSDYLWLEEVRASSLIVSVDPGGSTPYKYMRHDYARALDGNFEFGEAQEVERRSYWLPVEE